MLLKSATLQKHRSLKLSIAGHSSAPSISHVSVLGLVGPRSSVISAAVFSRQTDLVADSSDLVALSCDLQPALIEMLGWELSM